MLGGPARGWGVADKAAKVPRAYCFPDTNFFYYYTYFTDADWAGLLGARQVCLVIAPAVLKELDNHKRDTRKRLRGRAVSVSNKLDELLERGTPGDDLHVHGDLYVRVESNEAADAYFQGLDRHIPDDRIVAAALSLAAQVSDPVSIVTGDTMVRVKAGARGLPTPKIPEAWRLADEPDETEQELAKLKRQVAALEQREPRLQVALAVKGQAGADAALSVKRRAVREPSPEEVERRASPLAARQPVDSATAFLHLQEPRERLRASIRREAEWSAYVREVYAYEDERARSHILIPTVSNSGTAAARDVSVEIMFPDGFVVREPGGLPRAPEPPRSPTSPFLIPPVVTAAARTNALLSELTVKAKDVRVERDAARPSYLRYEIDRVARNVPRELPPFAFTFPKGWSGTEIAVLCRIDADSLPQQAELHLTIATSAGIASIEPWRSLDKERGGQAG